MDHHSPYTLAIIPARGGSKGIPQKNLAELGGIPLVAWSILAAKNCPLIHRVVVSTDDEIIAHVSVEYGAEVPFLRPASLAGDKASMGEATTHVIQQLDGPSPEVVITLFPTHPFRRGELMRFLAQKTQTGFGQVNTVKPLRVHSSSHFIMDENSRLNPIWDELFPKEAMPWVTLQRAYGLFSAYCTTAPYGRMYLYELTDPVEMVDIDTPEDLEVARLILQEGLFSLNNLK